MWKKIELLFLLLISAGFVILGRNLSHMTFSENVYSEKKTIVIDAGHGGSDPGKIGINQVLEKDINLQIAKKVKMLLEEKDFQVIMTRENDEMQGDGLSDRVSLINGAKAEFAVSIHQNSYSDPSVSGAQVFYYTGSEEGKRIAQNIQESFWEIEENKKREIKENNSYYLLKHVDVPIVIAECGFLSNPTEADKLVTEEYQELVSKAIVKGIEACFVN